MKTFRIENKHTYEIIRVTLYKAPYEDENILNKTGWNIKDVKIIELNLEEIE